MYITFTIPGEPQGKARARTVRAKSGVSLSYTPEKTVSYESFVKLCYKNAGGKFTDCKHYLMTINAIFSIPKSSTKKFKELAMSGNVSPTKKPDCDNIAKIICDALNGIAWTDDSKITDLSVKKTYGPEPCVIISISGEEV